MGPDWKEGQGDPVSPYPQSYLWFSQDGSLQRKLVTCINKLPSLVMTPCPPLPQLGLSLARPFDKLKTFLQETVPSVCPSFPHPCLQTPLPPAVNCLKDAHFLESIISII